MLSLPALPLRHFVVSAIVVACLLTVPSAGAAEQPLGRLVAVEGTVVTVAFDAAARIDPGIVIAVYAPGAVRRHPLTDEVIVEERRLVAKVQVVDVREGKITARLAWREAGVELANGFDCIPLPGTAAPNAVPVAAVTAALTVAPGAVLELAMPISDPDGDPLHVRWSIAQDAGRSGQLLATETMGPTTRYLAPLLPGQVTVVAEASDPYSQTVRATQVIDVIGDVDARSRTLTGIGTFGWTRNLRSVQRLADGTWLAHDSSAREMVRIDAGWRHAGAITPARDQAPSDITDLAAVGAHIHCLDASQRTVWVYDLAGKRLRQYGEFSRPTDLVVAPDGVAYVADQTAGGVLVYETDGTFRLRLGREGRSADAFEGLTRIDLAADGSLAALDAKTRRIHRFDRFHRRLPTWTLGGDAADPIDIAWHPQGLLVQLIDGRIVIIDKEGLAKEAFAALPGQGWDLEVGAPESLVVDANGRIYTCHARSGAVVRRHANGVIDGVRASAAFARAISFRQDGAGRIIGIQPRDRLIRVFDAAGFQQARFADVARDVTDVALAGDGSALFVLDGSSGNVRRYDPRDPSIKPVVIGAKGKNDGQFHNPTKLAVDEEGRVYVLDAGMRRVSIFDRDGRFRFHVSGAAKGPSFFDAPSLLAVSPLGDAIYVYDRGTYEVKKYALDQAKQSGAFVTVMGGRGDAPGQLREAVGLDCDRLGHLYVLDRRRSDVQLVDFRGTNPVVLQVWPLEKHFGMRSATHFAAGPDASLLLGDAGSASLFVW